ncbi:N-6 DNA methylase, partial [bacterium]|nr:N-6 DNA methylase [bacterium]
NNIKCGNSLIGPDFYEDKDPDSFGEEQRRRINAFNWKTEFPQIFSLENPGFNTVIGNPPYIPIEEMPSQDKEYFKNKYAQLQRKYDSSIVFILSMLQKLKSNGLLGFISSITWQTGENYKKLRKHLFTQRGVKNLVNLPFDVFKKAYVDTGIYIFSQKPSNSYLIYRFPKKESSPNMEDIEYSNISTELIGPPDYKIVLNPCAQNILERAKSSPSFVPLGQFTFSTQGLALSKYKLNAEAKGEDWYPILLKGKTYRYGLEVHEVSYADMHDRQSLKRFYESQPKILIRRIVNRQDRLMATYCKDKLVFKKDMNPFIINNSAWNPLFVLGILNSKLISYLYINTSAIATKDDFRQTTLAELRSLPIPSISLQN